MVQVSHRLGSYEIRFESLGDAWRRVPPEARVITDQNVFTAWGDSIPATMPVFRIPPGEASKSIEVYEDCLRWLASTGADRRTTVTAFGGGVVGDLAGFVAATFMRGLSYIQVPTSLLAQVDSSVGGKVGLDLAEGKNLVGAFHPPATVAIALETLKTLPEAEFCNGMAEVWKYAFAVDASLLPLLEASPLSSNSHHLSQIVKRCVQLKATIVAEDEFDTKGLRAILNFGHTVGHALEKLDGYQNLRHGEAISIGMVAEAAIGEHIGATPKGLSKDIEARLSNAGLPTRHPLLGHPDLVAAMRLDKKSEAGRIAVCLLESLGKCKLVAEVPAAEIEAVLCDL